jgi:signal peptidase I
MTDSQLATKQPQLYHRKWIGVLCATLIPGSAHFLAGQRVLGIFLLCVYVSLFCFGRFVTSVPGKPFDLLALFLFFVLNVYLIMLLIFSWRPIRRLGHRGWILFVLFVLIFNNCIYTPVMSLFSRNVANVGYGIGPSMMPTLYSSTKSPPRFADVFVNNAWIYYWNKPQRGDIVNFRLDLYRKDDKLYLYNKNEDVKVEHPFWTKRVVGLPGETIDIDPPYILINGKRLIEPDIFKKISESQDSYTGYCFSKSNNRIALPVTLGNDEYFLLGDNSEHSTDSRVFGPVRRGDIKSKVIRIIFPPSRIKEL